MALVRSWLPFPPASALAPGCYQGARCRDTGRQGGLPEGATLGIGNFNLRVNERTGFK